MQVSFTNENSKIYSITSASKSAIPEWLQNRNKNKLKYDQAWRNRIELIQDFQFPEASMCLKATRDGKYIMATGVYKPQIRVFDLDQMAMKFERHTNCENVAFEILSDDWQKSVHLQTDRSIEFHSHYGMHYQTRIPKFGRDLSYHYPSCDLLVCGASNQVWRLNLEQGRFMNPLETNLSEINTVRISNQHQLFAFGGSDGKVEFWHPTEKKCLASIDVAQDLVKVIDSSLLETFPQITSLEFGGDGLSFLAGTSTGQVILYDLRKASPILVKDHQYGFPIKSLHFHSSGRVISSDTKIVKIWNQESGSVFANIEAPSDINDVCVFGDSGLIVLANEDVQIQSYYIPKLGTAPKWCSFLDNLTEELEENPNTTVYDDYKFVTKKELDNLSLGHLIGSNVLKAYMHGFFIDVRLYEKAKAIANPFEFEEHKKRMVQKKIEEKRASRISSLRKLPKVNASLAAEYMSGGEEEVDEGLDSDDSAKATNPKNKKKKKSASLLRDDRFKSMFDDADFQVDNTTLEYKLHHPSESNAQKIAKRFEPVQDEQDQENEDTITSYQMVSLSKKTKPSGPKFYELKDGLNAISKKDQDIESVQQLDFASRLKVESAKFKQSGTFKTSHSGNLSVSFNPSEKKKKSTFKDGGERRSASKNTFRKLRK